MLGVLLEVHLPELCMVTCQKHMVNAIYLYVPGTTCYTDSCDCKWWIRK